jgi:hypothetical protein
MTIEAMKLLTEIAHIVRTTHLYGPEMRELLEREAALRQAIEQAQKQEQQHPMMDMPHDQKILHAYGYHKPQRQWVGLTDDEIWKDDAIMSANSGYGATFDTLRDVVRAVEAKLKEKNT